MWFVPAVLAVDERGAASDGKSNGEARKTTRTCARTFRSHSARSAHAADRSKQDAQTKMNPLMDIVIGTGLGLIAGGVWNQFKNKELKRTTDFYKFYEAQQAKKVTVADDDE